LLRLAQRVHVVSWIESSLYESAIHPPQAEPLCRWLAEHGVTAQVHRETTHGPVSGAMLTRAEALKADLIVMGAYGHSRWLEHLLGGATRGLLSGMSVPVLMSH
jgi:nucleotide-binding universal stress UspA family protein